MSNGDLLQLERGQDVRAALTTGHEVPSFIDVVGVQELITNWNTFPLASFPERTRRLFRICQDLLLEIIRQVGPHANPYTLKSHVKDLKSLVAQESQDYLKLLELLAVTEDVLVREELMSENFLLTAEQRFTLLPLQQRVRILANKALERLSLTSDHWWLSDHINIVQNMAEETGASQPPVKIDFILSSMKTSTAELIKSLADMLDKWPDKNAVASPLGKLDSIYFSANQPAAIGTMYFTSAHEILKQIGGISNQLEERRRLFSSFSRQKPEDLRNKIISLYYELDLLFEVGAILEQLKQVLSAGTLES